MPGCMRHTLRSIKLVAGWQKRPILVVFRQNSPGNNDANLVPPENMTCLARNTDGRCAKPPHHPHMQFKSGDLRTFLAACYKLLTTIARGSRECA
jgi:hypothetical protein